MPAKVLCPGRRGLFIYNNMDIRSGENPEDLLKKHAYPQNLSRKKTAMRKLFHRQEALWKCVLLVHKKTLSMKDGRQYSLWIDSLEGEG